MAASTTAKPAGCKTTVSALKRSASRRNVRKSTGPQSPAAKALSAHNPTLPALRSSLALLSDEAPLPESPVYRFARCCERADALGKLARYEITPARGLQASLQQCLKRQSHPKAPNEPTAPSHPTMPNEPTAPPRPPEIPNLKSHPPPHRKKMEQQRGHDLTA